MRKRLLMPLFFLIVLPALIPPSGFTANVFVPTFDITSWVDLDAEIQTRAQFDLSFDGGYKYQAKVAFQYYNIDVEHNPTQAIIFDGAQASVRDIFTIFDFTYWVGFYGILGEGKHYKGHLYHREGGFDYEGFYPVTGTGIILTGHITEGIASDLFIYQRAGTGYINSLDLTFRLARDPATFGLFTGVSDQVFRAGTQFVYSGNDIEFSLTTGTITIAKQYTFNFDDFYFLAEEWFKMGKWDLILSAFTRPIIHYNYVSREYAATNERNDIDFNFDLFYTTEKGTFSPGGEFNIRTNSTEDLGISLSPYLTIYSTGLVWRFEINFNLLSKSRDLLTAYLNLQSSF